MSDALKLLDYVGAAARDFFVDIDDNNIIEKVVKLSVEAIGADRGTLFIDPDFEIDKQLKYIQSYVATGIEKKTIILDVKKGVAGHVFTSKKSYFTNDTSSDLHFCQDVDHSTGYTTKSVLAVPLHWKDNKVIGVLEVLNKTSGYFDNNDVNLLEFISIIATVAIESFELHQKSLDQESEVQHSRSFWKKRLETLTVKSKNPNLQAIYENLPILGPSESSILITGESGTGKEVMARLLHANSRRRDGPFVAINCAAIPENLFEAELFGVAKGAATGTTARKGQVELAHEGTLFLDEIGEMPLEMQAKLLRVLQERKVTRVGGQADRPKEVDFRLICATNKNLESMIQEKNFRDDLYYRICVVNIRLPALRERREDLPDLVKSIIQKLHDKRGWKVKELSEEALNQLRSYTWPGNIRELENKIENALLVSGNSLVVKPEHLQLSHVNSTFPARPLVIVDNGNSVDTQYHGMTLKEAKDQFEEQFISAALESTRGNKTETARLLGLSREGLRKILTKKGLSKTA